MIIEVTRASVGRWARRSARLAFVGVIAFSPMRARLTLIGRPTPPIYGDFTDVLMFWSDVALVLLLGCWVASLILDRRRPAIGPRFLAIAVGVLLVSAVIGIPFSEDPALSLSTVVRFVLLAALAVYVRNEIAGISQLVVPTAAMLILQAGVAIGQVIGQESIGLGRFGEYVLSPSLGVSVVTTRDGTRVLRAYGLSDHPNLLGGLVAFGLLAIVGAAVVERGRMSIISGVALALGTATLVLTFSRGAWIGLIAGFVTLAAVVAGGGHRERLKWVGLAAVGVAAAAAPFLIPFRDVLSARSGGAGEIATETRSVDEREALARVTTRIVADHPLLGVGLGALPLAIREEEPDFEFDYQPAATVLLDATAELGTAGGAAMLVILVGPWVAIARHRRRWTAELAGAAALQMAVTVVGLFDYYPWTYLGGRLWSWIILGLFAGAYQRSLARIDDAD